MAEIFYGKSEKHFKKNVRDQGKCNTNIFNRET